MDKKNGKKTNKEKRVLIGALCVAAVMIAGSTFAWFTSKDEVTNRLSASAEYNVAVAETFQPPENWVPGQEINKDAAAVNTGNVDAFARMWLTGSMRLMNQNKSTAVDTAKYASGTFTAPTTAVTDVNLKNMSLTYQDANGNYFKTLDKNQTINPNSAVDGNNTGYAAGLSGPYSEVQAMQSGILAFAPNNAEYSYVLKQETNLKVLVTSTENGNQTTEYKWVQVPAGTLVVAGPRDDTKAATIVSGLLKPDDTSVTVISTSGSSKAYTSTVYIEQQATPATTGFIPQNIEVESFTPKTPGLYLFLRNEENANQQNPEFSGYFMSGTPTTTANTAYENVNFFALNTNSGGSNRSDNTVKGAATGTFNKETPIKVTYDNSSTTTTNNITLVEPQTALELYTAKYDTIIAAKLNWFTNENKDTIYAVYENSATANTQFDDATDIVVEISLANVGTDAEKWTPIGAGTTAATYTGLTNSSGTAISPLYDASKLTYYYNNDVEAGDSSAILVDKVKLYDGVTQKAYLAFDFDLNVNLESVQVTMDENGNEAATAVARGWAATQAGSPAADVNTGATGTQTPSPANGEITKMAWS